MLTAIQQDQARTCSLLLTEAVRRSTDAPDVAASKDATTTPSHISHLGSKYSIILLRSKLSHLRSASLLSCSF